MEVSGLAYLKKWLQSNKNFTYSFNEFFLIIKLSNFIHCIFHYLLILPQ